MAKVTFTQNLGTDDAAKFGVDPTKCKIGDTVDLPPATVKALTEKYPALFALEGVAAPASIHGVSEESPVSESNANEAIAQIANMRSKDKLQHVIDNDPRVTVKEAAKKRLAEL